MSESIYWAIFLFRVCFINTSTLAALSMDSPNGPKFTTGFLNTFWFQWCYLWIWAMDLFRAISIKFMHLIGHISYFHEEKFVFFHSAWISMNCYQLHCNAYFSGYLNPHMIHSCLKPIILVCSPTSSITQISFLKGSIDIILLMHKFLC